MTSRPHPYDAGAGLRIAALVAGGPPGPKWAESLEDADEVTPGGEQGEEQAAAREAAAIGGSPSLSEPADDEDPALRPLGEAGQGEAEGFELAEAELEANAERAPEPDLTAEGRDPDEAREEREEDEPADESATGRVAPEDETPLDRDPDDLPEGARRPGGVRDPFAMPASEPEAESSAAVYGEADEAHSSEMVEDPAEGPDDPGHGPGTTPER